MDRAEREGQETSPQISPEDCSLVRALGFVGERWTMLLLRQAFYGVTRFDEMQSQLGTSRKVLAERLGRMVRDGLLRRVAYREGHQRGRYEYQLTAKGRDLMTALVALMQWADRHMPHADGRPLRLVERGSGQEVNAALVRQDGSRVENLDDLSGETWPDRPR